MLEMLLAQAFWLIGPAYAANAFPPLARGKMPVDFGKKINGKRILGDGKTIEGTLAGIIFGLFYGAVQILLQPYMPLAIDGKPLELITVTPFIVFLLVIGAILGDFIGSFIKRRARMERGKSAPGMDQLGFLIAGLVLVSLITAVSLEVWIILIILTPLVHWIANLIGYYLMRVKQTPW
ncbi:MAG: CDP-2,3-bis-(O-geranylgeranyl)-sn-glycerol synthase [Candidatus Aenigmarchaeota archaeon]|nr:CDP-2,3-bis-(O-geranylgeranyl)-sn-glycerol synthase [Candidatus Aenigmarchaeota archaeon]